MSIVIRYVAGKKVRFEQVGTNDNSYYSGFVIDNPGINVKEDNLNDAHSAILKLISTMISEGEEVNDG